MKKYFALGLIALSAMLSCHYGPDQAVSPQPADDNSNWFGQRGTASFYGPRQNGRRTASGSRFDQKLLTAAHAWLPFGTRVRVTLGETGRSVIVTITDRLYSKRRIVDLSVAAATELGIIRRGIAEVILAPA
jgi:rare lipoprotein A